MSFARQHLFLTSLSSRATTLRSPILSPPVPCRHFTDLAASFNSQNLQFRPKILFNVVIKSQTFALRAYELDSGVEVTRSSDGRSDFDAFLAAAELFCFISSAVVIVSYAVNCTVLESKRTVLAAIGSGKAYGWGLVALVSGVVIGGWIRRRQWERISVVKVRDGRESVNLVERIEKLEEDLRSSATIIRVMSRQLEKLGTRFRVTRKSLKDPIAETAALAQKTSEATRALAIQEDLLEKELVEIQKVLLAMQEQQQKQLDLILAIGKATKLWESKQGTKQGQAVIEKSDITKGVKQLETHQPQSSGASKGTNKR